MRRPVEVTVGGKKLKVVYVDSLDGGDGYGDVQLTTGVIRIALDKHKTEDQVSSTLFHELLHYALHLTGHSEAWTTKQEETIVSALENMLAGLYTFKKDAPVKWKA